MEKDKNLGSLLPACCCCKTHTSTGSSLYLSSPPELLYIVITLFGTSCLYLFLVALFLLGINGVVANMGFVSSSCRCPRVDRSNSPLLQLLSLLPPFWSSETSSFVVAFSVVVGSYVLLVALSRFVHVSKMAVVKVPWS